MSLLLIQIKFCMKSSIRCTIVNLISESGVITSFSEEIINSQTLEIRDNNGGSIKIAYVFSEMKLGERELLSTDRWCYCAISIKKACVQVISFSASHSQKTLKDRSAELKYIFQTDTISCTCVVLTHVVFT